MAAGCRGDGLGEVLSATLVDIEYGKRPGTRGRDGKRDSSACAPGTDEKNGFVRRVITFPLHPEDAAEAIEDGTNPASIVMALRQRLLPPLCDNKGIAGIHLCLADESISKVETAEKKARADTTQVPTWIILIEGNSSADVGAAGAALSQELQPLLSAGGAPILTSVYQLEFSRCKTPWSAG